jgi:transcriptional regulator with XRE-family HTH domain
MTFGEQVTSLRKAKSLSQNDLGKKVDTSGDIIGKYERNEVKPSIEVASKIADVLEVSLDFLLGKTSVMMDKANMKRLQDIEALPDEDRSHIFYALDNLIKAAKLNAM